MSSEIKSALNEFQKYLSVQLDKALVELALELEIADAELTYGTSS